MGYIVSCDTSFRKYVAARQDSQKAGWYIKFDYMCSAALCLMIISTCLTGRL